MNSHLELGEMITFRAEIMSNLPALVIVLGVLWPPTAAALAPAAMRAHLPRGPQARSREPAMAGMWNSGLE